MIIVYCLSLEVKSISNAVKWRYKEKEIVPIQQQLIRYENKEGRYGQGGYGNLGHI